MRQLTANRTGAANRKAARKRPGASWRRGVLRCAFALAVAGALAAWAVFSGYPQQRWNDLADLLGRHAADAGLVVEQVLVDGRERTDRQSLIEALGIGIGEPILDLDLAVTRQRVLALPWIRDVSVERRLPATVVVTLVERRPLALWQDDGRVFVIDAEGDVIDGARPADFSELFLVVGAGAPGAAAELLAMMEQAPELRRHVLAAVRIGHRRWNLSLDEDVRVRLPEVGMADAWFDLARMNREEGLLARDVEMIDLRFPDRLVVRLTPEARARRQHDDTEGEDT